MNTLPYKDKIRIERLICTFEDNFRITQLYAAYLESFPEIITKEIINELCCDSGIRKEDAIAALLCEFFALDTDKNEADRRIFRNYILPSIRILDPKKYTENPYYKNVKLPDKKLGNWEFKNESYAPYRAVICHDMIIGEDFSEIPPLGFFEEKFEFPAVLEDGNEWMTLTPVDLDTCEDAISSAFGKVVTFGLGLGYYAYMVARRPEVDSITIVEKSHDVIKLFKEYVLPYFEHPEKVRIVCDDAFDYAEKRMPNEKFDYAFVDTWRDASDGAPMYERMKALEHLSPNTRFSYWIENFLVSNIRAKRFVDIREDYRSGKLNMSYEEIERKLGKR
ncbi:MAG: hypothetical protein IJY23_08555 [Clostridia bacterium]|nr:hypothetical protein [Clostridia bacterium]